MFKIREIRQMEALVSPLRQAIVDVLEGTQHCAVSELAEILDRHPDCLYYHLRVLEEVGLLLERRRRGPNGRTCRIYELRRRGTTLDYRPDNQANAAVVTRIVASMARDASRVFRRSFAVGEVVRGPRRTLCAGRRIAWLTKTELGDINTAVNRTMKILERASVRRPRTRLYMFFHLLAPYGRR